MRKINLPLDSSAKIVGPRLLHGSQWGIIDPLDTPDGGNIGLHKHLSIMTKITKHCSNAGIIQWLRYNTNIMLLSECSFRYLGKLTKIFINHAWIGGIDNPNEVYNLLINSRKNALISIYTSINWDIINKSIYIYTDAGRLCHPVFYIDRTNKQLTILNERILELIKQDNFSWNNLISGFNEKKHEFNISACTTYVNIKELYATDNITDLKPLQAVIEYIDTSEEESAMIAINIETDFR